MKFGGTNPWQFDFEAERDLFQSYIKKVLGDDFNTPKSSHSQALEANHDEFPSSGKAGGKQVRFSSGLPPTRQSRFGSDNEGRSLQTASLDRKMLQKGSASGNGFRRRQVSRLMSLQHGSHESGQTKDSVENGSVPTARRQSEPVTSSNVTTIGDIMLRYSCA